MTKSASESKTGEERNSFEAERRDTRNPKARQVKARQGEEPGSKTAPKSQEAESPARNISTQPAKNNQQTHSTPLVSPMGVASDFLPRVLESGGRPLDLADYRGGIPVDTPRAGSRSRSNSNSNSNHERREKRPLRIGIDVSSWIYRAGFALGDRLMGEDRYLTALGRADLQREQQQQQQQQRGAGGEATAGGATENNGVSALDSKENPMDNPMDNPGDCNHPIESPCPIQQQHLQHHPKQHLPDPVAVRDYREACANYVVKRLELLKEGTNADLLVVFDGRTPPVKARTVAKRRRDRWKYQSLRGERPGASETAIAHQDSENKASNHYDKNKKGVDADVERRVRANRRAGPGEHLPGIVDCLLGKLRQKAACFGGRGLSAWMVAPYEADSQLAYLSKRSYIDLVVTEDSDLVAHGCRSVLYKCLDHQGPGKGAGRGNRTGGGNANVDRDTDASIDIDIDIDITRGKLLEFRDLGRSGPFPGSGRATNPTATTKHKHKPNPVPDLADFTPSMVAVLFVLLGCDYNGYEKLRGIGLATACRIVRNAFLEPPGSGSDDGNSDHRPTTKSCLERVWEEAYASSYDPPGTFTERFRERYQASFAEALLMYRHPVVFDPLRKTCLRIGGGSHRGTHRESDDDDDEELLKGCKEYSELLADPERWVAVVGEVPSTREECISIAEGRTHQEWRMKKPTPVYASNNNNNSDGSGHPTTAKRRQEPENPSLSKRPRRSPAGERGEQASVAASVAAAPLGHDEIVAIAAGGYRREDPREPIHPLAEGGRGPAGGDRGLSRALFPEPPALADASPDAGDGTGASTGPSPPSSEGRTVPLSEASGDEWPGGKDEESTSRNLLASTATPEPGSAGESRPSGSNTPGVGAGSSTQTSLGATTQTLSSSASGSLPSQTQSQSQTPRTLPGNPDAASRGGTPLCSTPEAESVDLLASSSPCTATATPLSRNEAEPTPAREGHRMPAPSPERPGLSLRTPQRGPPPLFLPHSGASAKPRCDTDAFLFQTQSPLAVARTPEWHRGQSL